MSEPYLFPALLLVVILAFWLWKYQAKKKSIKDNKEQYRVQLSDAIQEKYFDEYEKEKEKEKGL